MADSEWFVDGVQVHETTDQEWFVDGVGVNETTVVAPTGFIPFPYARGVNGGLSTSSGGLQI